mmetsp:Transcript_14721/g.33190  ORF Transcript_14721/g.33190 Transcript_14721/m.33190 type:complete len:82 (+) Transcript_14721:722-967(+)
MSSKSSNVCEQRPLLLRRRMDARIVTIIIDVRSDVTAQRSLSMSFRLCLGGRFKFYERAGGLRRERQDSNLTRRRLAPRVE